MIKHIGVFSFVFATEFSPVCLVAALSPLAAEVGSEVTASAAVADGDVSSDAILPALLTEGSDDDPEVLVVTAGTVSAA